MSVAIETLLEQRSRQLASHRHGPSLLASLGLHTLLVASVVIAPMVTIRPPEPIEFVPVSIVPLQALGVETPSVAPPRAPAQAPPKPVPVEAPAKPPVLPSPEKSQTPEASRPQDSPRSAPPESLPGDAVEGELARRQGSPFGSTLGTAAFGATVGGLDHPDFVYGYYVDQMLAMISAHWRRPALGGEVTATVHFRIHRDGDISELRVVQSSGFNSFDLSGLRAVQLAAPFPKLPQSFRHNSLGVNLILR